MCIYTNYYKYVNLFIWINNPLFPVIIVWNSWWEKTVVFSVRVIRANRDPGWFEVAFRHRITGRSDLSTALEPQLVTAVSRQFEKLVLFDSVPPPTLLPVFICACSEQFLHLLINLVFYKTEEERNFSFKLVSQVYNRVYLSSTVARTGKPQW